MSLFRVRSARSNHAQVFESEQIDKGCLEFGDSLVFVRVECLGKGLRPPERLELFQQTTARLGVSDRSELVQRPPRKVRSPRKGLDKGVPDRGRHGHELGRQRCQAAGRILVGRLGAGRFAIDSSDKGDQLDVGAECLRERVRVERAQGGQPARL